MVRTDPHPGELSARYSEPFSGNRCGAVSGISRPAFNSINVAITVCLRPFLGSAKRGNREIRGWFLP